MNPYIPKPAKIKHIGVLTDDTNLYRLDHLDTSMPGQFYEVSIPGIGEAPISVASHSEDRLDLIIRNVGNLTNIIHGMEVGANLWLRGPYGTGYPVEELKDKDLIVVAGGTGAAPVRGLLKYIEQKRGEFWDVKVFLGFRNPESILSKDDIEGWRKDFDVKVTVDTCGEEWCGDVGVVTNLLKEADINKGSAAVTCGPPVMIKYVVEELLNRGVKEEAIYTSLERLMMCGIGKCGHCMVGSKYACMDGPVFSYDEAKNFGGLG